MNRTLAYDVMLAIVTICVVIASFKGWGYL
jgi:hypothetical protein